MAPTANIDRKPRAVLQTRRLGRSVIDYENPDDLRRALEERMEPVGYACEEPPPGMSDWMLSVPDPDAEPQTVSDEIQRLLTLKSYLLLDQEKEEAFDRLTREACRVYDVPTSLISLVDLGRQFLFSNTGADVRETHRTPAFCSHTILSNKGVCVVPDCKLDPRFRDNCFVTGGSKLRFYAGAPLISPEGYKLGTFCVEGPEPRPQGLSEQEKKTLQEFAKRTMALMVERRYQVQRSHAAADLPENHQLRRHAAIATNLGALVCKHNETVVAMSIFQEAVQTLMYIEHEESQAVKLPSKERQAVISNVFDELSSIQGEGRDEIIQQLQAMFPNVHAPVQTHHVLMNNSIPGIFSSASTLKGRIQLQSLFFSEPFEVSLEEYQSDPRDQNSRLDDRSFIIPLNQCSKATLFNMGLIHYKWGSLDNAMQFFDLAASLSHPHEATNFDPVILGCLNNMAQIHLMYGRPNDAMELLRDALTRGNAALSMIYNHQTSKSYSDDGHEGDSVSTWSTANEDRNHDARRTRRLRRKLSRTVLNIGNVHFYRCDYENALRACQDALNLLHTNKDEIEVAAVWYNMSLLLYHQGNKLQALEKIDTFLEMAQKILPPEVRHQLADAFHRKGKIMFEMGRLYDCMIPLNRALQIRRNLLGNDHPSVAESLNLIGKVLHKREEYDFAMNALQEALAVQHKSNETASLDIAQTLLDIGSIYHVQNQLEQSLKVFTEVIDLTRKFFGERHPFVARIENIIGNLYLERGETTESIKHFQDAMKIHVEQGLSVQMDLVEDPLLKVDVHSEKCASAA